METFTLFKKGHEFTFEGDYKQSYEEFKASNEVIEDEGYLFIDWCRQHRCQAASPKKGMFIVDRSYIFNGDRNEAIRRFADGERLGSLLGWCLANLEQHYPDADTVLTSDYLDSIGFEKVKDDGQYATYHNKAGYVGRFYGPMCVGKRILIFNRDGNYITIKEDAGTRTVFNGVIKHRDELEIILNCVA
jgi:hypothetical protein